MLQEFGIYSVTMNDIVSHLSNAFILGMIMGNNLLFGYILVSEYFSKSNSEIYETINQIL